jgi:hypothetical protein
MSSVEQETFEAKIGRQFGLRDINEIKNVILKMEDSSQEQLAAETFKRFEVAADYSGFSNRLRQDAVRDIAGILVEQNSRLRGKASPTRRENDLSTNCTIDLYKNFAQRWIDTNVAKRSAETALGSVSEVRILGLDPQVPGAGMVTRFTSFIEGKFNELNLSYFPDSAAP